MQHYYDNGLVEGKGPPGTAPTLFKAAASKWRNLPESNLAIWAKHHLTYIFVHLVILMMGICYKEIMLYAQKLSVPRTFNTAWIILLRNWNQVKSSATETWWHKLAPVKSDAAYPSL